MFEAIYRNKTTTDYYGRPGKWNDVLRFKAVYISMLNFSLCNDQPVRDWKASQPCDEEAGRQHKMDVYI